MGQLEAETFTSCLRVIPAPVHR